MNPMALEPIYRAVIALAEVAHLEGEHTARQDWDCRYCTAIVGAHLDGQHEDTDRECPACAVIA